MMVLIKRKKTLTDSQSKQIEKSTSNGSETGRLPPSRADIAHSHAAVSSTYLKRLSPLPPFHMGSIIPRHTKLPILSSPGSFTNNDLLSLNIPQFLGDTNPILITVSPTLNGVKSVEKRKQSSPSKQPIIYHNHDNDNIHPSLSDRPIIRKIQMNPYIVAAKNEEWTDPQTSLVYKTDLCNYLGHERKDSGRHTLTGIGQYTKTMLNIKVYGVGFYASKRDILADPSFQSFSNLSSERLRESSDFFQILRSMKGFTRSSDDLAGNFDRTIFI